MKHRILDVNPAPIMALFVLECNCGHIWHHRSDKEDTVCPKCQGRDTVTTVKKRLNTLHPDVYRSFF